MRRCLAAGDRLANLSPGMFGLALSSRANTMKKNDGLLKFIPLFIFILAFTARAIFFVVMRKMKPHLWNAGDLGINGWLEIAQNLAAGKGYSTGMLLTYFPLTHLVPAAARGPLPVLVLAGLIRCFPQYYPHLLFPLSWMFSAACAVLLYSIASRALESRLKGLLTAGLYALYLPEMNISTTYAAASESIFTLLFLAYLWALLRHTKNSAAVWVFQAGFFLGCAALARPIAFYLLLVAVPSFFFNKPHSSLRGGRKADEAIPEKKTRLLRSLRSLGMTNKGVEVFRARWKRGLGDAILFLFVFMACLLPWVIRNQKTLGTPLATTTLGGYNLLRHNGMIEQNNFSRRDGPAFDPIARALFSKAGHQSLDNLSEIEADRLLAQEAKRIIRCYPVRYLKLCVKRLGWLWYKENQMEKGIYLAQNIPLYVCMLAGMIFAALRRNKFLSFLSVHILFFIIFHAAVVAQFRFLLPVMPLGILLAVYAVSAKKVPGTLAW